MNTEYWIFGGIVMLCLFLYGWFHKGKHDKKF